MKRSAQGWTFGHRAAPYLFLLPFVALFGVFLLYPLTRSFTLSFYKSAGPRHTKFIGLGNYRFLMHDRLFWLSVANSTGFAIAFVGLQIPLSLGLAVMLDHPRVRLRRFFRFAFFSSHLIGGVFAAVIVSLLLAQRTGLVNRAIAKILPSVGAETNWLGSPRLVMVSIIIASLWLSMGYGMIYFLAALQAVDRGLYEAAEMDGAGLWARFFHITLPGVRPVLLFLMFIGTIGAFQLFELPYILFQGPGPQDRALTIVMYLFMQGFEVGDIGYASAVGWMLVAIIFTISLLQLYFTAPRGQR